jgi:hypothetical protein
LRLLAECLRGHRHGSLLRVNICIRPGRVRARSHRGRRAD